MWKLYTDAACTNEFNGTLDITCKQNLSDNPQDFLLYYANVDDDPMDSGSLTLLDNTVAPAGTENLSMYLVDANPGAGHEATEITLALTAGELGSNDPGDPLDQGAALLSGVSNAQPIHIRQVNAVTDTGVSTELTARFAARVSVGA